MAKNKHDPDDETEQEYSERMHRENDPHWDWEDEDIGQDDDSHEPVGSCDWCGVNLYDHDDPGLCDQCLWHAEQNRDADDGDGGGLQMVV